MKAIRLMRVSLLLVACGLSLVACVPGPVRNGLVTPADGSTTDSTRAVAGAQTDGLSGPEWLLRSLNGEDLVPGTRLSITFAGHNFSGFAGCNRYGGDYTVDHGTLKIGMITSTAMGCVAPGVIDQETAYLQELRNGVSYRLAGDRLEIADATGRTTLVFARQAARPPQDPAGLIGTAWRLVSLNGAQPAPGSTITLAFADGQMDGTAGCRRYNGSYAATSEGIRFTRIEMLGQPCADQGLLVQESHYTDQLSYVTYYRRTADRLELGTDRGEMLRFEPIPAGATPAPLPATAVPVTPEPASVATPQRTDGSRFQAREGFSFVPPAGWYFLERFDLPEGRTQYTFDTAPRETRGVPGELELLVLVAPGATADTWRHGDPSTDVMQGDIAQQQDLIVDDRPATQLEYDMHRQPRPAELTAGARLAVQDGGTFILFWAFAPTWDDFAPYRAQVQALFASVHFDGERQGGTATPGAGVATPGKLPAKATEANGALAALQAELERVTAEELAHGCLAWDARVHQQVFCGESKAGVDALMQRLQDGRRKLEQPGPDEMAEVVARIRALRGDPSLEVVFDGVSGNPYSATGRRMETYRDNQGMLYMVDLPTRTIIQYGPGPDTVPDPGEMSMRGVPILSALTLRGLAEAYLARHVPGFDEVKQTFLYQESSKSGTSYAFRWESPLKAPGEEMPAFVQLVLAPDGTIKSFNDTRVLYEGG